MGCSPWGHSELDRTERLHFHFSLSCIGEGNGNPLQCPCLENARDGGALWAQLIKKPPAMWETWILSLGWEDPLEKAKATHSSSLAWRISWTIQSKGSQRVGHD